MSAAVAATVGYELKAAGTRARLVGLVSRSRAVRVATEEATAVAVAWEARRDPEAVAVATLGPASEPVYRRAFELAVARREDASAVEEVGVIANGDGEAVAEARRFSRLGGVHRELAVANRLYRLLGAASADSDVELAAAEDAARFDAVARFIALDGAHHWEHLVELEPRLQGRDGQAAGKLNRRGDLTRWYALNDFVDALLGPLSGQRDPLLASRTARNAAVRRLDLGPAAKAP